MSESRLLLGKLFLGVPETLKNSPTVYWARKIFSKKKMEIYRNIERKATIKMKEIYTWHGPLTRNRSSLY
jgi:hypothetical protein